MPDPHPDARPIVRIRWPTLRCPACHAGQPAGAPRNIAARHNRPLRQIRGASVSDNLRASADWRCTICGAIFVVENIFEMPST